jgi:hypothetical protein
VNKTLQWFQEFERLGYHLQHTRSGHHWAIGPAGDKVTVLGSTPSDHRSCLNERARLRRHQQRREAAARKLKPSTLPESLGQAGEWERVKSRYLGAGLCHRCSAQAAYAHEGGSGGWGRAHPPCVGCVEIVELFPYPTAVPEWRCLFRKRSAGPGTR